MSQRLRPIPVGILVSVSGPPRRRRTSMGKLPSIRKEVNLPLRVGIGVSVAMTVLVALTALVAYGINRRAPANVVAQRHDAVITMPMIVPVEAPVVIADVEPVAVEPVAVEPAAPPPAPRFVAPINPAPAPLVDPVPATNAAPACSNYGTAVTFLENPPDAFRQAAKENKLVLMVHVSGNFDDPAFT